MKRIVLYLSWLVFCYHFLPGQCPDSNVVFINELHYDNAGADENEGVEIAGPAGTALACYRISLYNGATGKPYEVVELEGTIPEEAHGYGTFWIDLPGMQNGAPDGLALYDRCRQRLIRFISYEGTFAAVEGDAAGLESEDIGVAETNSTRAGLSLQLVGGPGVCPEAFRWEGPRPASGAGDSRVNEGQVIGFPPGDALRVAARPFNCVETGEVFEITVCAVLDYLGTLDEDFQGEIELAQVEAAAGTLSGLTRRQAENGCATFRLSYDQVDTLAFIARSDGFTEVETGNVVFRNACKRLDIIAGMLNPCGEESQNELLTARTRNQAVEVKDIVLAGVDHLEGIQPNVNHSWSPGGDATAGDPMKDCGAIGLRCHRFLNYGDPEERALADSLLAALNQQAGCRTPLFVAPPGQDMGSIPPNSQVVFFLGAGGNPDASTPIPAGFDELRTGGKLDFSSFCELSPIYVVFGFHRNPTTNFGFFSNTEARTYRVMVGEVLTDELTYQPLSELQAGVITAQGQYIAGEGCTPHVLFQPMPLNLEEEESVLPGEKQGKAAVFQLLRMYPNPASTELHLRVETQRAGSIRLQVIDGMGVPAGSHDWEVEAGQHHMSLPLSRLSPGLYILRLSLGAEVLALKFIRR